MKKYTVISLYPNRQCLDLSNQPEREMFDNEDDADSEKRKLYEAWKNSGQTYDPVYCVICLNFGK